MATQRPDITKDMGRGTPGGPKNLIPGDPYDFSKPNIGYGDARNAQPIINIDSNGAIPNDIPRDLIKFNIKVIDPEDANNSDLLIFRAYLDDISDDYSAQHNSFKYNGRAEKFYTYSEFDRTIQFKFRIQAQSRQEMKPLHQKLNYLVAQTAPSYKNGRMRAKFARLTIGDWVNEVPGFFQNVNLSWQGSYSWEIDSEERIGLDGDRMNQLPHQLDVNCTYKPVHDFAPENDQNKPFILPYRGGTDTLQKWADPNSDPSVGNLLSGLNNF